MDKKTLKALLDVLEAFDKCDIQCSVVLNQDLKKEIISPTC